MPRLGIRPFSEEHVDDAARLLARRHERHLAARPLLPAAPDFRSEVEELWRRDGASGTAAVAGGRLVGYLVGSSRPSERWGPNLWIESGGHAALEPEVIRDLYAAAADRWVERGLTAQYVLVPATDAELVDAWFRLGFGAQSAHGILGLAGADAGPARGVRVRQASTADLGALVALSPLLSDHHHAAPVFSHSRRHTDDEIRGFIDEDLAATDVADLVAEVDGRIVGTFVVRPVGSSETHSGLARPPGAALLAFAVTDPQVRGSGAGLALTRASFSWARDRGYETMVTDWRETNLLASRFWPQRGFERTFLRLHRQIA
jgi:ribosomal protein S18 acetylase RimI-like enzyme